MEWLKKYPFFVSDGDKRKLGLFSVFLAVLFCLFNVVIFSHNTYALDWIYIDLSTNNLTLDIYANSPSGTFKKSEDMTISVATNSYSGYTLSLVGPSSTNLTNGSNSITSISSAITEAAFSNSSNTSYNNKWGYKPSQIASGSFTSTYTNTANSNFRSLPGTSGELLAITNASNITTADTYTISIGARITASTPPGSYISDTFTITATANIWPITMQNINSATCTTTPTVATDIRDGKTYTIQRLSDGACWMLDNLALDPTAVSLEKLQGNTNASNEALAYLKNGGGTTSDQYAINGVNKTWSSASDDVYSEPKVYTNAMDTVPTNYEGTIGNHKTGVYYNYCAASAGTYCYGNGTNPGTSYRETASEDICPAGWRLPTNNDFETFEEKSEYDDLSQAFTGIFVSGSISEQNEYADFWTSSFSKGYNPSLQEDRGVYEMIYMTTNMTMGLKRKNGTTIRCVSNNALYDKVAAQTKGTLAGNSVALTDTITAANSGVYTYAPGTYGASSDTSNDYPIYFYRGMIDSTYSGSYGSTGDGVTYPNYVKLVTGVDHDHETCWRIFRTTGSGGVKMIYNGLWSDGTCAKSGADTQAISSVYFNRPSAYASETTCNTSNAYCGTQGFVVYVGYNYNSTYGYNNTGYTSAVANTTVLRNGTSSNIRTQIEDWFDNILSSRSRIMFETSAGYCNDRTTNGTNTGGSATTTVPYKTASAATRFAPYNRTVTGATVSLTCLNTSGYDLLSNANRPIFLITADEAALSGNGNGTAYNSQSFLAAGSPYWTLSPMYRNNANGLPRVAAINGSGQLVAYEVSNKYGVRPVVSLVAGTEVSSGSGTATDPWVVEQPPVMQDYTLEQCAKEASRNNVNVVDWRDKITYSVRYIEGACWMTSNLRWTKTTAYVTSSNVTSQTNMTWYDLSTDSQCRSGNGYNNACKYEGTDNNGNPFVLYNFAAASVMSITGESNSTTTASQDICPLGWHLPDYVNATGFPNITGNINEIKSGYSPSNASDFSPTYYGYWDTDANSLTTTRGDYWSRTYSASGSRRSLTYTSGGALNVISGGRQYGRLVRCVRTE
ncbi:hypothetical protein IKG33_02650 [Candidatus Saccharibacteria bacterium]|nr:hypothetical protein [Candidatus Saccharibacteria bacterium]